MNKEQLHINLLIVNLRLEAFYLAMKDHWDSNDFAKDKELSTQIRELHQAYMAKYKVEPLCYTECTYHDDVVALKAKLSQELNNGKSLCHR